MKADKHDLKNNCLLFNNCLHFKFFCSLHSTHRCHAKATKPLLLQSLQRRSYVTLEEQDALVTSPTPALLAWIWLGVQAGHCKRSLPLQFIFQSMSKEAQNKTSPSFSLWANPIHWEICSVSAKMKIRSFWVIRSLGSIPYPSIPLLHPLPAPEFCLCLLETKGTYSRRYSEDWERERDSQN